MKKIILIILILLSIETISYSYTWEDFIEFNRNTQEFMNTNNKRASTLILNNQERIINALQNKNIDIDNFDCFDFYGDSSELSLYISRTTNNTIYGKYTWEVNNINGYVQIYFGNYSNNISIYSHLDYSDYTFGSNRNHVILNNLAPYNNNYSNMIANNYFNYINILSRENLTTSNLPWYIADGQIGIAFNNDNYKYYLHDINNNISKLLVRITNTSVVGANLYQIQIPNIIDLINGNEYYISLQESGDTNSILNSNTFIISWENSIDSGDTNQSGDNNAINLNETNNLIKNIPNQIGSTFYNSGDSGEKGIIQKVYEDLFTLQSGDLEKIIQSAIDTSQMPSGELQAVKLRTRYNTRTKPRFYYIMGHDKHTMAKNKRR